MIQKCRDQIRSSKAVGVFQTNRASQFLNLLKREPGKVDILVAAHPCTCLFHAINYTYLYLKEPLPKGSLTEGAGRAPKIQPYPYAVHFTL